MTMQRRRIVVPGYVIHLTGKGMSPPPFYKVLFEDYFLSLVFIVDILSELASLLLILSQNVVLSTAEVHKKRFSGAFGNS